MAIYKIAIEINASKEAVWETITNFSNYPKWNSVLEMKNNDDLIIGNKFQVTIMQANGKRSKFKAITIHKEKLVSFSATQTILGKWFFKAIHHFTLKELDKEHIQFVQTWELKGIIVPLFRKQIFKELSLFKQMNKELKEFLEN